MKKLSKKPLAIDLSYESIRLLSSQELVGIAGGSIVCVTQTCPRVCGSQVFTKIY